MKTTVLYTCTVCGIVDRPVQVTARTTEDVKLWLEQIMSLAIADDHAVHSPHCRATHMTNVKIPTTGTDRIGGPVVQ